MKGRAGLSVGVMGMVLAVMSGPGMTFAADPPDWPNWRGPNHDGVSTEKGWLTTWPKEGLKQLWTAELGPAYGSVAVSGGKVFCLGSNAREKEEVVYCLNADTGREVWRHTLPDMAMDSHPGPRCTPAVDGKSVYVLSTKGGVCSLDAASGQVLWSRDLKTELELALPHHMFSSSPIVDGDLVLLNMGPGGVALDKKTGNVVWKDAQTAKKTSAYASPVPFTVENKRRVAILTDMALVVVDAASGQVDASLNWPGSHGENSPDPMLVGDKIFVSTPRGCVLLRLNDGKLDRVWRQNMHMASRCTSPVLVGDYVYGFSGNPDDPWYKPKKATTDFVCVDVRDGSLKWVHEGIMEGSLMAADGKLIIVSRPGDLILAEASPEAYKEIARAKVLSDPQETGIRGLHATYRKGSCWAMPVLCSGRIYVRNNAGTLGCYDLRGE